MSCDEGFSEARVAADPRLKITLKDGGLSWKTQDMNFVTARECAARAALHIRRVDMYGSDQEWGRIVDDDIGPMVIMNRFDSEDQQTICIAHETGSGAVQIAVNGMAMFQATILCESLVSEMNKAMVGEEMNGATI